MDRRLIDSFESKFKFAFRNIKLAILVGALLFALCVSVEAQQPAKLPRIGYLTPAARDLQSARIKAFRQGLLERGYTEGKNIIIEYRFAEGKLDRAPDLAAELVRLNVDIIVVQNSAFARATKRVTSTIPIVMLNAGNPFGDGLIASLARPDGNVTGLTNFAADLGVKRLELLREMLPKLARVGVLTPPMGLGVALGVLKEMQDAAPSLKLQLHIMEVRAADDFERILKRPPRRVSKLSLHHGTRPGYSSRTESGSWRLLQRSGCLQSMVKAAG